ncbi:TPA: phage antirepressor, partial [Enterococcus faecium]|nr:phage antirepressor [Enterococcus faecium]
QQIAEYEPKISYLDTILSSTDTVATSQIAADYGMSAIALNKLLNELGVQHKVSGQWILYRKHMNQGYTKSHTSEIPKADGGTKVVMNTKWTQKGRVF